MRTQPNKFFKILLAILLTAISPNVNAQYYGSFGEIVIQMDFLGSVVVADFNGDYYDDFLVTGVSFETGSGVYATRIYLNDRDGTFSYTGQELFGFREADISVGDFNSDNHLDVIISGDYYIENYEIESKTMLFQNDGSAMFTSVENGIFPNDEEGIFRWGDFDSDGDQDVFCFLGGYAYGQILENVDGQFNTKTTSIPALVSSEANWADYDDDGDLDLLVIGRDANDNSITRVYKNTDNHLSRLQFDFPGIVSGCAEWGDYDEDGDLDIFIAGSQKAYIYNNTGGDQFTQIDFNPLMDHYFISAKWGDFDLDGDLDLLTTSSFLIEEEWGVNESSQSVVFENLGDDQFSRFGSVNGDSFDWIDYDKDGDLDVIALSYDLFIHENAYSDLSASPPSPPSNLRSRQVGTSMLLEWDPSTDSDSYDASIQYNVRFGIHSNSDYILTPMSNPYQGDRMFRTHGNALYSNEKLIHNVSPGDFYWGVQAIDNSGKTSEFSFSGGTATMNAHFSETLLDSSFAFDQAAACWGDYNDDGYLDAFANGKVYSGNGEIFQLQFNLSEFDRYTHAQWVDYDNDGDLDISFCGYNNSGNAEYYFNIFENVNNNFSLDESLHIPGISKGGFCWRDFNSDGLKDLIVSGLNYYQWPVEEGVTKYYLNSNAGGLLEKSFPVPTSKFGMVYSEDIDADQDFDILFWDYFTGEPLACINDGDGNFSSDERGLPDFKGNCVFGDYDSDGDVDLLLSGQDFEGNKITQIYRNNFGQFSSIYAELPGLAGTSINWMDMDGDSDLDMFLYGYEKTITVQLEPGVNLYGIVNLHKGFQVMNMGSDLFDIEVNSDLPFNYGVVRMGDYDNDGDHDMLVSGGDRDTVTYIGVYENNYPEKSTPPGIPQNPESELDGFDVILSWDEPLGNPDIGYSYDIKVGTSPGDCDIVAPDSDPETGFIRTMHLGNVSVNNKMRLKNLPLGKYYWSVLAINQSYQSSHWASEGTFTISEVSPDFESDVVCRSMATTFIEHSVTSDAISGWKWEFGDGNISTSRNPQYIFSTAGTHQVTLWAYTQSGDSASVTLEVEVKESPEVLFETAEVCDRELMWFSDQSNLGSLSGISYSWEFGDDETSTSQSSVSHLYSDPDTYSAILTISADNGCSSQFSKNVTVAEYPNATISLEPGYNINFCSDDSTILAVADNATYNYQWQLNGVNIYGETGHSITVKGPTGEYSVWVENPVSGCVSEDSKTVTVRTAPALADINLIGEDEFCERDSSMLYISDSPGMSYQWLLNGGEVGKDDHIFFANDAGYYTCKRTNEYGCSSTSSKGQNISVIPGPATPILLLSGPTMFCEGQSLTLNISDPGMDIFQWLKDDLPIGGETGTSLSIGETGHFKVRASNGSCESFSQGIVTTVSAYPPAPVIVSENYEEGDCQGEEPITLRVETPEQSALYLWKRNGDEISGATGSSYTEFLAEGEYLVELIKNGCGTESEVQTIDYGEMPERPEIIVRGPVVWYLVCSNENASEYRWYFNEERIQDADEVLYVAGSEEGRYEVAISDGSRCFSRSEPVWIPLSTGIESDPFTSLKIFPNPTPGVLKIEMDNALMGELLIDIFTEQGSKILNLKFIKETTHFVAQVDLSAQPAGMYLIDLIMGEYRVQRKLVVE